jgi:serine/threonine protein kinase
LTSVDYTTTDLQRPSVSSDDQPPHLHCEIGRVLRDRYVLVDKLGSGGKGSVFKALDRYRADLPAAQQFVAIKILHATAANRKQLLANLRREFYLTQMLSHRNLVNVFELDSDGEVDFFTMEFLEGELLSRVMGRLQPLPLSRPQAWAVIREIGSGLEYAHSRNVVHADLKPQNIMITDNGEVRILDFGASSTSPERSQKDDLRPRNAFSSVTPAYACCELLEGRPPDPRDDIYALACLSYELLAGAHPFQGRRATEARDFRVVPSRPLGLSRPQWQALTRGLSWHRAGRSISVRAWLDKLNSGRSAGPLPSARDLQSAPANLRPASYFRAAALFAVLLICLAAWGLVGGLTGKEINSNVIPAAAASGQFNTGPVATGEGAGPPGASTSQMQAQVTKKIARDVIDRPKLATSLTSLPVVSAGNYTARPGERFAEIRVHRSSGTGSDTALEWWTEAASAKPGVDYVQQGKAIQSIPRGKSSISFFVKLVPTAFRTQPEVFYIAIAAAGGAALSGQVARAAVWLPTIHTQAQAVVDRSVTLAGVGKTGD